MNLHLKFDNLNDFWNYAWQESNSRYRKSRNPSADHWSGGVTWDEAKELAIKGWKEGLEEIEKYRAKISPMITERVLRPIQVYSVSGYNVDIGTYLSDDPECFISRVYEERNYPGKIFKMVVSITFSYQIQPETIIQRGAMICALIDAIEYAGHRVEVICNEATSRFEDQNHRNGLMKEHGWLEVDVCAKETDQPLDMSSLAFCLAHPAMLRRVIFSIDEFNGWADLTGGSYGFPASATDKGDIYIAEVFSGVVPDDQAIKWVLEELVKLGVDLEVR